MAQPRISVVATLRKAPIIDALAEEERSFLVQRVLPHHFKAHELIFCEGGPCCGLHFIETGSVKIFGSSRSGREQILATQGPGDTLGELPVLDGGNYPVSAIASTESDLLLIGMQDLQAILLRNPAVRVKLLELVASRVRPMISMVEQLCFRTVRQRLVALLLRLAESERKLTDQAVEFTLALSYRDLAAQIGTVPEMVSRNLSSLQALGVIKIRGKRVVILNPKSLRLEVEI